MRMPASAHSLGPDNFRKQHKSGHNPSATVHEAPNGPGMRIYRVIPHIDTSPRLS